MRYLIYIFLTAALGGAVVFNNSFQTTKLKLVAGINSFFDYMGGESALKNRVKELEMENENLKVELLNIKITPLDSIPVYSTSSLNNIKDIAIAAGANDGLKENMMVTYGKNILIGKIKKVFPDYSTVTTIFDPNWKMEVRIGEKQTDGLFTGGNNLTARFLPKKTEIKPGEIVITSGLGFPYGLEVGRIKEIIEKDGAMKEALIEPLIQLQDLRYVSIYK